MMRRIAVILFCVLICQIVSAQVPDVNESVELGHQKKYYVDFPCNIQPSELDINGKISQVEYTTYELEYKFGEFQKGSHSQIGSAQYQYNSNGQLTRFYKEVWDGWRYSVSYNWQLQYDANGNIVSNNHFYENGKLSKVIDSRYGDVTRIHYTNGGVLDKVINYLNNGNERYTVYFQNGDAIKEVTPPAPWNDYKVETTTYSYNNHKLTKGNGKTYTYNAKGLVSRIVDRYRSYIYDYTYEYDSKGNWIKRTCAEKDENGYIKKGTLTVRKITYLSGSSTTQNTGSSSNRDAVWRYFSGSNQ